MQAGKQTSEANINDELKNQIILEPSVWNYLFDWLDAFSKDAKNHDHVLCGDDCPACEAKELAEAINDARKVKRMTLAQIKENADMAETWPDSGVLNFGEIGIDTLSAWVEIYNWQGDIRTDTFDIESIKGMFEDWWKNENKKKT